MMSAGFAQRMSSVNRPGSRAGTAASGANAMRAVTAYGHVRLLFLILCAQLLSLFLYS